MKLKEVMRTKTEKKKSTQTITNMNEKFKSLQQKKYYFSTARSKMNEIKRISGDNERIKWNKV